MKNFKFLLASFVVAAGTTMLCSCFSDPYCEDPAEQMTTAIDESYTVTVTTNVPAQLSYNGTTVQNVFKPTANGTLAVSANGYVSQNVKVTLGANKNIVLDVNLIKVPTSNTTVGDVQNATNDVVVESQTRNSNGEATSSIDVSAGTTVTGVADNTKLGIDTYIPTNAAAEEPEVNKSVTSDVLVAVCEPTGATFSTPVKIAVAVKEAAGMSFNCTYDNGEAAQNLTVGAKELTAEVNHFSNWTFKLNAKISGITEDVVVLYDSKLMLNAGVNTINYQAWAGVASSRTGVAEDFLKSQYGALAKKVSKTANVSVSANCSARVRVVQNVKKVTFSSGSVSFTATIYGAENLEISEATYDTSSHSGGAGSN
ncbi:MAG: hypothetical protein ACI4TW_06055 [Prevotella sp.]